ncbi:hypothetical protein [Prosthecobacter sp.]|jgi:hypothetical protein|uniref:hypothetical protein n=1 Tax=Prosthecobacter sp. TaxID=1965333 RepID=UPI0037CCBFB7
MRFFFGDNEDNFVLIPTVIVQLGRCQGCGKVAGICLLLSWLNIEVGLEIPFNHHD